MKSFSSNQLFILLAAVTIALFALVTMEETRPRPAAPAPVFTPPASEIASETEPQDETENWKVYRSEEYGFEMKYPSDWSTKELGSDPIHEVIISKGDSQLRIDPNGNGRGAWFTETKQSQIIVSGVRGERTEYLTTDTKETFFVWIKFVGYNKNGWDPAFNQIFLQPKLKDLGSSTIVDPGTNMQILKYSIFDLEILDQIFSTFRFIERASVSEQTTDIYSCNFWKDKEFGDTNYGTSAGTTDVSGFVRTIPATIWDEDVERIFIEVSPQADSSQKAFYQYFLNMAEEGNSVNTSSGQALQFTLGTIAGNQISSTASLSRAAQDRILNASESDVPISLRMTVPIYVGVGAPANFSFACSIE